MYNINNLKKKYFLFFDVVTKAAVVCCLGARLNCRAVGNPDHSLGSAHWLSVRGGFQTVPDCDGSYLHRLLLQFIQRGQEVAPQQAGRCLADDWLRVDCHKDMLTISHPMSFHPHNTLVPTLIPEPWLQVLQVRLF